MALGLGLQLAFNGYVLQVCKTLRSCNESQQVQQILQDLLELVTLEFRKTDHSREPAAATSGALAQALHRVQRDLLHDPAPRRSVITALSQHLEVITTTLLPVLSCNSNISSHKTIALAQKLYQQAPALAMLPALTAYASSVSQEEEQLDLLRPRGQAVGTELAAAWLAERFALPESIGTQQLCQDVACLQCGTSPRATSTGRNNFPALRCDELAQALVGLTDSCFSHMQSAFDSTCFVPHVIHQLWLMVIQLLPETSSRNSSASACGMTAVRFEGSDPQWAFIGGVCAKLCRRGFVSEVAQSLWQHCLQQHQAASDQVTVSSSPADEQQQQHQQQSQSPSHSEHTAHAQSDNATGDRQHLPQTAKPAHNTLCEILLAIKDSDATEKLLTALLLQAGQDPNQSRALLLMRTVISPQWDRKHIRLCTSKLLLQLRLPLPGLSLLVQLLKSLKSLGVGQETVHNDEAQGALLVATKGLVQVWADKGVSTRLPVKQQAYIAAAVAMCIAETDKACLERTKGLLPGILQGISLRLDNPVEAIRRQAMRVGNAFSTALDPAKPLLFAEFPLDLLQEEQWHPSAARLNPAQPLQLKSDPSSDPSSNPFASQNKQYAPAFAKKLPAHRASVQSQSESANQQIAQQQPAQQNRPQQQLAQSQPAQQQPAQTHPAQPRLPQQQHTNMSAKQQSGLSSRQGTRATGQIGFDSASNGPTAATSGHSHQHQPKDSQRAAATEEEVGESGKGGGWGSDHETDSDDDSLEAYDLSEGDDDGLDSGEKPMQLRDIAAALRKSEEVQDKLRALRLLEGALLAAPDELQHYAGELSRALLHLRTPDWADEEAQKAEDKPQVQRYRSTVALLVEAPQVAGDNLTQELYSPHLDMHQRMLILETLSTAAQQLADPRLRLQAGHQPKTLLADHQGLRGAQTKHASSSTEVGRTRRWGVKALQKQQQQRQLEGEGAQKPSKASNAFLDVALPWAAGLLRDCDQKRHGVDLFGRDPLLLGRLLITLGTFVECCGAAPITPRMAACVLELVRSPGVHSHAQPYVRRSALLASAQVVATLPPSGLAGAMGSGGGSLSTDAVLVEQLQWLQAWVTEVASQDVDMQCQQLASACQNLQGSLATKALEALEKDSSGNQTGQDLNVLPIMQSPALLMGAFQAGSVSISSL